MGLLGGTAFLGTFYLVLRGLCAAAPEDPELARMRPYVLALIAAYAAGLLSLSRCYHANATGDRGRDGIPRAGVAERAGGHPADEWRLHPSHHRGRTPLPCRYLCLPPADAAAGCVLILAVPVTVIIPTFNCRQWVREAIDSALNQTLVPAQVIVVDDGSTDGTTALLADYRTRIRILSQPNQGVAAARNRGLASADTEWIAFLDADDVWHPRKLELQMRIIAEHPDIGLLGTGLFPWPAARISTPVVSAVPRMQDHPAQSIGGEELPGDVIHFDPARRCRTRRRFRYRVVRPGRSRLLAASRRGRARGLHSAGIDRLPQRSRKPQQAEASMEAGMKQILHKLDTRDFWRGDRMLRQHAYSYVNYSCAYARPAAGHYMLAIRKLLDSMTWYPLPNRLTADDVPFGRARRLAVLVMRMLRLMSPIPTAERTGSCSWLRPSWPAHPPGDPRRRHRRRSRCVHACRCFSRCCSSAQFLIRFAAVIVLRNLHVGPSPQFGADPVEFDSMAWNLTARGGICFEHGPANFLPRPAFPSSCPRFTRPPAEVIGSCTWRFPLLAPDPASSRIFSRQLLPDRASHVAAILAAVYVPHIYFATLLLSENLFVPVLGLVICLLFYHLRTGSFAAAVGAGLFLGVAILTRPFALLLVPILLLCMALQMQRIRTFKRWPAAILLLLCTGACRRAVDAAQSARPPPRCPRRHQRRVDFLRRQQRQSLGVISSNRHLGFHAKPPRPRPN